MDQSPQPSERPPVSLYRSVLPAWSRQLQGQFNQYYTLSQARSSQSRVPLTQDEAFKRLLGTDKAEDISRLTENGLGPGFVAKQFDALCEDMKREDQDGTLSGPLKKAWDGYRRTGNFVLKEAQGHEHRYVNITQKEQLSPKAVRDLQAIEDRPQENFVNAIPYGGKINKKVDERTLEVGLGPYGGDHIVSKQVRTSSGAAIVNETDDPNHILVGKIMHGMTVDEEKSRVTSVMVGTSGDKEHSHFTGLANIESQEYLFRQTSHRIFNLAELKANDREQGVERSAEPSSYVKDLDRSRWRSPGEWFVDKMMWATAPGQAAGNYGKANAESIDRSIRAGLNSAIHGEADPFGDLSHTADLLSKAASQSRSRSNDRTM